MAMKSSNAFELRQQCRDHGLEPSWYLDGHRCWMTVGDMQLKLKLFAAFKQAVQQHSCDLDQRPAAPTVVHMFWDNIKAVLSKRVSTLQLQAPDLLGLWSCLRVGMTVHLWTYSALELFTHPNLHIKDSSVLLSKQDAKALLGRGLRIQHLADLVRLLAAQSHGQEVSTGSWIGDLDQLWLRPFGPCPSGSGHVFATMHAKGDIDRGSHGVSRYWKYHFVRTPDEQVHFSNSPMAFPAQSGVLDSSLISIRSLFSRQRDLSKLDYTAVIKVILQQLHSHGLALDVVDPIIFHPLPHFVGKQRVFTSAAVSTDENAAQLHGVTLPSCGSILQQAFVLSQTWFSWSFQVSTVVKQPIEEGSLYASIFSGIGLSALVGHSLDMVSTDFLQGLCADSTVPVPVKRRRQRLPLWKFDVCPLGVVFRRLPSPSGLLRWEDYLPVAAVCRMALNLGQQELRVKFGYTVERMIRIRAGSLRRWVSTPSALSIWAGALALWRTYSAQPGFDPSAVAGQEAMTVDCFLACSRSVFHHEGLRESLCEQHDEQTFERMCSNIFASTNVMGEPFYA